ncbi:hypothetical protein T484DRAFT_1985023 [Baffinella frigidus]|nr:hypothetical protein T484DRAFT_1985023 [Cryptophyta sp. CCMP2293]
MQAQLAKEAALRKTFSRTSSRWEVKAQGSAMPQSTGFEHPLRLRSMPQLVMQPTASDLCARAQSAAASTHGYERLPEDAATINHRTVQDLRDSQGQWDKAEETLISAFFLVWAVGVIALGGWHVANQLSASVGHLQVAAAVLAATCTPVVFLRINRQASPDVRVEMRT